MLFPVEWQKYRRAGLTFVAAVQQRFGEHVGVAHGCGFWLHLYWWRPQTPYICASWSTVHLIVTSAQWIHTELLQLVAFQLGWLRAFSKIAQVAVARHLQGPNQAVQRAVTAPGVVIDPEVAEVRQREQDLLGRSSQSVVLEQQRGELGEPAERALLHHGDVILLEVKALQLRELGEHVVPQNLNREMRTSTQASLIKRLHLFQNSSCISKLAYIWHTGTMKPARHTSILSPRKVYMVNVFWISEGSPSLKFLSHIKTVQYKWILQYTNVPHSDVLHMKPDRAEAAVPHRTKFPFPIISLAAPSLSPRPNSLNFSRSLIKVIFTHSFAFLAKHFVLHFSTPVTHFLCVDSQTHTHTHIQKNICLQSDPELMVHRCGINELTGWTVFRS